MDDLLVLNSVIYSLIFFYNLFSEADSLKDETDGNDRLKQKQRNTVVMHICAHENFRCACVVVFSVVHMKVSEWLCICVCLCLF